MPSSWNVGGHPLANKDPAAESVNDVDPAIPETKVSGPSGVSPVEDIKPELTDSAAPEADVEAEPTFLTPAKRQAEYQLGRSVGADGFISCCTTPESTITSRARFGEHSTTMLAATVVNTKLL